MHAQSKLRESEGGSGAIWSAAGYIVSMGIGLGILALFLWWIIPLFLQH